MKKILLGLLLVGALSACTSAEEHQAQEAQVQALSNTVTAQTTEYESLKAENEKFQTEANELNDSLNNFR